MRWRRPLPRAEGPRPAAGVGVNRRRYACATCVGTSEHGRLDERLLTNADCVPASRLPRFPSRDVLGGQKQRLKGSL